MSDSEDKVVSFEEHRRRKVGPRYVPDFFSTEFEKALSEQSELLEWYRFNRHFNKHRLFLHALLLDNEVQRENPSAGYALAYTASQCEELASSLSLAARLAGREFLPIVFAKKSLIEACAECSNGRARTQAEAFEALEYQLLTTEKVLIVSGLSQARTSVSKTGIARDLIKVVDDMWLSHKAVPKSCLVFIDSPTFLQRAWPTIGNYLNVLG